MATTIGVSYQIVRFAYCQESRASCYSQNIEFIGIIKALDSWQ